MPHANKALCEFVAASVGGTRDEVKELEKYLDALGQDGRLVFLFDGLDEVSLDRRDDAEALIQATAARYTASVVFVTARQLRTAAQGGFHQLEMLPLDRDARIRLVAGWLHNPVEAERKERAGSIVDSIGRSILRPLGGNPLYLTLFTLLLEDGHQPADNRLELHLQLLDLLLTGRHRRQPRAIANPSVAKRALAEIALRMTKAGESHVTHDQIVDWLTGTDAAAQIAGISSWGSIDKFLDDIESVSGVMGSYDGPFEPWRFWHPALRDALAATAFRLELEQEAQHRRLTGDDASSWSILIERASSLRGVEDQWGEVYALLVSQAPDPDLLITTIADANRQLGVRTIATTRRVNVDTIREVLRLSNDWQERRLVIESALQMNEPERALELLESIRRSTTRLSDLYFIGDAFQRVGVAEVRLEELTRELRTALYDHITKPDPKQFEGIPGRPGSTAWLNVPAGLGTIGDDADHTAIPAKAFAVALPFMLGAIPVTVEQFAAADESFQLPLRKRYPITNITWFEAVAFCDWLAQIPEYAGARLPTEAEWEYACRSGLDSAAQWGCVERRLLSTVAWYHDNSQQSLHPVAQLQPSLLGFFDLHGNVNEWCADVWRPRASYSLAPALNTGTCNEDKDPNALRTCRGGSYLSSADELKVFARSRNPSSLSSPTIGMRVLIPSTSAGNGDGAKAQ